MTNSRPTGFAPVGRQTKFHDITASSLPFDQPCLVAPCNNAPPFNRCSSRTSKKGLSVAAQALGLVRETA